MTAAGAASRSSSSSRLLPEEVQEEGELGRHERHLVPRKRKRFYWFSLGCSGFGFALIRLRYLGLLRLAYVGLFRRRPGNP